MSDEWVMVPRKLAESQRNAMAMTHRHDYGIREEWERENIRKHMDQLHRAMLDAAPAWPQLEPVCGDVLPPIGSRVWIRHGRDDDAHACIVTGYYAWPDLGGKKYLHRVSVRLVYVGTDTPNSRMLCDVYPSSEAALSAPAAPQEQAAQQCVDIGQELGLGYERKRAESAAEVFERGHTEGINDCLRNGLDWAHEYMGGLPGKRAKSERHEQEQAEPVAQIGWAGEFGNLFPMGAWKPTQRTHHDSHKTAWRAVYLHPPADEVQRLRDALKPFAAIDLTTNQAVDPMDVLRARRALEGK